MQKLIRVNDEVHKQLQHLQRELEIQYYQLFEVHTRFSYSDVLKQLLEQYPHPNVLRLEETSRDEQNQ
jgi:hypothetical protein